MCVKMNHSVQFKFFQVLNLPYWTCIQLYVNACFDFQ